MNLYYFFVVLSIVAAAGTLILAWLSWRKDSALARIFALLVLSVAWWGFCYGFEALTVGLVGKEFLARFKYFGVVSCPILLLVFVLKYASLERWLKPKYILAALIIPFITLVGVWTDPWHHLFYTRTSLNTAFQPPILMTEHGLLFWLHSVYSYLLLLISVIILAGLAVQSRGRRLGQQLTVLFATLIPVGANALHIFELNPFPEIDPTPLAFLVTAAILYASIFRLRLLDIAPIARRMAVENMQDGMLVLDLDDRISDLNPAFADWLSTSVEALIGKNAADIFPAESARRLLGEIDNPAVIEVVIQSEGQARILEAQSSLIINDRNDPIGRVILMRDVTERKRFEQSIRQAKEQLETTNRALVEALDLNEHVFSATPVGILTFNAAGECVMVNDAILKMLRISAPQILHQNFHTFRDWRESGLLDAATGVLASEKPFQGVFHFVGHTGEVVWIDCSMAFFTRSNQPHLLLMLVDITAQRMAEEQRKRSDARFHTLVESMGDLVFTLDREFKHTALYGRWVQEFNIDRSAFLGRTAVDLFGPEAGQIHIDSARQALEGKTTVYEWNVQLDASLRYFQTSLSPMWEDDQVIGIVGIGRDVTGLKNLEKDLEEAKALLEQAFEQSLAPMVLVSCPSGVVEMINAACCKVLRLPGPESVVGKNINERGNLWDIREPDGRLIPEQRRPLDLAIHGGTLSNAEYLIRYTDGMQSWILMNATPILNKSGVQIAALLVFVDITDRKQFERAEREQRMIAEAFRDTAAILNSTIQLDTVLTLVLSNIERVVPHDAAHVVLFDEEGQVSRSRSRGYIGDEEQRALDLSLHAAATPEWRERRTNPPAILLPDVAHLPDFAYRNLFARLHAFLHVPIRFKDKVIGLMTLSSVQPDFFNQIHAGRLQVFADQAAMAIENARLYTEVQHLTLTDELTRVYNYRGLLELGQREFDRARRFSRPLSVLFYDIDHFRNFNNRYTHAVGNQVLQTTAKITRSYLRGVDLVARYGGEEFVVLLPETKLGNAVEIAERLREEVEETYVLTQYGRLSVTISIGVATITEDIQSLNALIERANQAEHYAKQAGRNRVSITPLRGSADGPASGEPRAEEPGGSI